VQASLDSEKIGGKGAKGISSGQPAEREQEGMASSRQMSEKKSVQTLETRGLRGRRAGLVSKEKKIGGQG